MPGVQASDVIVTAAAVYAVASSGYGPAVSAAGVYAVTSSGYGPSVSAAGVYAVVSEFTRRCSVVAPNQSRTSIAPISGMALPL